MAFRFRKSKQIAPGVRLNVGRKSAGISVGNRFFRKSVNTSGRTTTTVSAPGTGISHSTTSTRGSTRGQPTGAVTEAPTRTTRRLPLPMLLLVAVGLCLVVGMCAALVR